MDPELVYATKNLTNKNIIKLIENLYKNPNITFNDEAKEIYNSIINNEFDCSVNDDFECDPNNEDFNYCVSSLINEISEQIPFDFLCLEDFDIRVLRVDNMNINLYEGEYLKDNSFFKINEEKEIHIKPFKDMMEKYNMEYLLDDMDWLFVSYY